MKKAWMVAERWVFTDRDRAESANKQQRYKDRGVVEVEIDPKPVVGRWWSVGRSSNGTLVIAPVGEFETDDRSNCIQASNPIDALKVFMANLAIDKQEESAREEAQGEVADVPAGVQVGGEEGPVPQR